MQTPDGYWRVEAVRRGRDDLSYRIIHGTTVLHPRAAIATVQHVLGDAYATLEPVNVAGETDGVA